MQRIARVLLALVFAAATAACAQAPLKPKLTEAGIADPTSALYVGNFIAAGMPGFRHRGTSVTISGSGFDWHDVNSYFRPNAVGAYSFGANNVVSFNKLVKLFDVAIMMDCSQCPLNPQLKGVFHDYAKTNAETVRKYGTKPVYFMSWAYQDAPEMTAQLAEAYVREANANDAFVIPAGLAFARSVAQKPDLNLYVADKRHPGLAGTYLAACTTYAALFKRSPVGSSYTAGLPADVARHLQTVAWETVGSFYGWH